MFVGVFFVGIVVVFIVSMLLFVVFSLIFVLVGVVIGLLVMGLVVVGSFGVMVVFFIFWVIKYINKIYYYYILENLLY